MAHSDTSVEDDIEFPPGPDVSSTDLLRTAIRQLLGTAPAIHDRITDLAAAYGDIVGLRRPRRVFLVSDPELVHQILTEDSRINGRAAMYSYLGLLLGNGLVTSEGAEHDRNRRLVAPAFTRSELSRYAQTMAAVARELDEDWSQRSAAGHAEIDMAEEMGALALRIAGLTLFGVDLVGHSSDVNAALKGVFGGLEHVRSPLAPLLLRPGMPIARRVQRGVTAVHQVVDELVAQHKADPDRFAGDVLSLLLAARDEDGSALTDRQIRDEVTTLLVAGHETTANLLAWAWYNLATQPGAASLLHAELDALPGPPGPADGFEPGMPVTRAVIAETLRFHPPVWSFSRRYREPGRLGEYPVPQGVETVVSQWVVHRDPRWWGQDADRFQPQRWLRDDPSSGCPFDARAPGHPRHAFFPFGAGRRVCIGEQFAWVEGVLCLATLARHWAPVVKPGWTVDEAPQITLRPRGGLPMTLVRRG